MGGEGLCRVTAFNNCNEMEAPANSRKLMKICRQCRIEKSCEYPGKRQVKMDAPKQGQHEVGKKKKKGGGEIGDAVLKCVCPSKKTQMAPFNQRASFGNATLCKGI